MTRPKKGSNDKRELIIKVRMNLVEKNQLRVNSKNAGMTPSDFIRSRTVESTPLIKKATPERAEFISALGQLGKIGSNLNQIARALNRRSDSDNITGISSEAINISISEVKILSDHLITLLR